MQYAAFLSGHGRNASVAAAILAVTLAGCSANVSRFDFPAFSSTAPDANADYSATASLPPVLPEEPVYASAASPDYRRASLPPPSYSQAPAPTPAAYSPAPAGRVRDRRANYPAPAPAPAVWRGTEAEGPRITVQRGDTLSSLSRQYGVSVEAIQAANNLPDGRLTAGQKLIIPGGKLAARAPEPAPPPAPAPEPEAPAPRLAAAEPAAADGTAVRKVKTTTILPPGATSLAEEEEKEAADAKPAAASSAKPEAPATEVAASPEITGEDKPRLAKVEQLPSPEPMSGNSFRWPVKGRIISQFGTRPDGGHNDGIDVAVPQGTPVQAAENGVVAYAGNELKGYGNLVLIRHANNWVSAYAHNAEILVKRGDQVKRGQVIAKAGATGAVSQPMVHFELRKGSRPVDPTKYMSSSTASAD
jgi:murein DD-endopeptidase MepM/ murein hydrolase activator NlpD